MFSTTSSIAHSGLAATIASGLCGAFTSYSYEYSLRGQKLWKIFFDHLANTGHYVNEKTFQATFDSETRKKIISEVIFANKDELQAVADSAGEQSLNLAKRSFVICSVAAMIATIVAAFVGRMVKGSRWDHYSTEIGLGAGCATIIAILSKTTPLMVTVSALSSFYISQSNLKDIKDLGYEVGVFGVIVLGIASALSSSILIIAPLFIDNYIKMLFITHPFAKSFRDLLF